jgi:hypothetical protein
MHKIDKGGTPRVSSTVAFISRHATSNLARGRGSTAHINPSSLYIVTITISMSQYTLISQLLISQHCLNAAWQVVSKHE